MGQYVYQLIHFKKVSLAKVLVFLLYFSSTANIIALSILHIKHYQQLKDVTAVFKRDPRSF